MTTCIDSYLELCRPFVLPSPWNCCAADEYSRQGPPNPAAALATLMERHSEQRLMNSGIVKKDADGRLVLHPLLAAPDVAFVVLIDTATGRIYNLMTEAGCVLGDKAPMFEVLGDKHTFDALDAAEQEVFLTDTITDAILLRSFGLAAAPICGLSRLNQAGIDLLCEHYGAKQRLSDREEDELQSARQDDHGFESAPNPQDPLQKQRSHPSTMSTGPAAASQPPRYIVPGSASGYVGKEQADFVRLTLVRWIPHQLSMAEPASMPSLIDELVALQRHRRLNIDEVHQWTPTESDLETIRFALTRNESSWIKEAFLDSVYSGVGMLWYGMSKPAVTSLPTDLAGAVEHLQQTMQGAADKDGRDRRRQALRNYHQVVARQITRPMLRQAEATADPLDRALQLQFVQLNTLFLEKAPTVRERMLLGLAQPGEESAKAGDKSVSELLAISSQMVALAKEMTKWKPRPMSTPSRTPMPKSNLSRRFADSDLVAQN